MSELISLELGRVALLTLVNPPLNLVTRELLEEFAAALTTLAAAAPGDVRAVVVTGQRRAGVLRRLARRRVRSAARSGRP